MLRAQLARQAMSVPATSAAPAIRRGWPSQGDPPVTQSSSSSTHVPLLPGVCMAADTAAGRRATMTAQKGSMPGRVHSVLPTSLGELTVVREGRAVTGLYFPRHWPRPDRTAFGARAEDAFADIASQLKEYLAGTRIAFDLPLLIHGTDFDRRVWELVSCVPYGQTTTYGDLARSLGAATDLRDVGAAVGRNPLCILIPCHRVVGSNGKLVGYAGGIARKRALLEIEHTGALRTGLARAVGLW